MIHSVSTKWNSPMPTLLRRLLICAYILVPAVIHAEIYTWTDKNGKVHYADKPPIDKDIKATVFTHQKSDPTAVQPQKLEKLEPSPTKSNEQIAEENKLIRKENCLVAQKRFKMLQSNANVTQQDKDGNIYKILTKERVKLRKETAKLVQDFCG
jgi:hypothetical protein